MYICDESSVPVMKDEISAAVLFLTRLIGKNEALTKKQVDTFKVCLYGLLTERFKNHWFPEKPCKGQAYRCIRVNEAVPKDPVLHEAAQKCGLKYDDLHLPIELTVWVDPHEVCCRFGEHKGSYCTVASFKNGNKENFIDTINIEELEQRANEILKTATQEVCKKRKTTKSIATNTPSSPRRNDYSTLPVTQTNILQQLPTLSPAQNFQPSLFLMSHTPTYSRAVAIPQRFHFQTMPSSQPQRPAAFFPRPMFHGKLPPVSSPQPPVPPAFFRPFGNHMNNCRIPLSAATVTRQTAAAVKPKHFQWMSRSPHNI